MNTYDIEELKQWGLKLYPCKIARTSQGAKLPAEFITPNGLTRQWKASPLHEYTPDEIISFLEQGYELGAIMPATGLVVVDTDDLECFNSFNQYIEGIGIDTVFENSLSYSKEKFFKRHYFFKTNKSYPSLTPLNKFGLQGKGELLGAGRLVYLNKNGWHHPPSDIQKIPELPEIFNKEIRTVAVSSKENLFIAKGERHTKFVSFAGTLYGRGVNIECLEKCLLAIYEHHCEKDCIFEKEIVSIARSFSNYAQSKSGLHGSIISEVNNIIGD